jgi:hypothetical protein
MGVVAAAAVFGDALFEHKFDNMVGRFLRASSKQQFIRALQLAIYSFGGYIVISGLAAAIVASSSAGFWNPTHPAVQLIIFSTAIWVSLISLMPIMLLLARAVPDFGQPSLPDQVGGAAIPAPAGQE